MISAFWAFWVAYTKTWAVADMNAVRASRTATLDGVPSGAVWCRQAVRVAALLTRQKDCNWAERTAHPTASNDF